MKHVQDYQYKMYQTDDDVTYYIIGDGIRNQLLAIIENILLEVEYNDEKIFNDMDRDALFTMPLWLINGSDLSTRQWTKFGKMLKKCNLPNTVPKLAKELGWKKGKNLTRLKIHEIEEKKREATRVEKERAQTRKATVEYTNNQFTKFFD